MSRRHGPRSGDEGWDGPPLWIFIKRGDHPKVADDLTRISQYPATAGMSTGEGIFIPPKNQALLPLLLCTGSFSLKMSHQKRHQLRTRRIAVLVGLELNGHLFLYAS
jgi:hypothetical protein